jgi:16S rRNA (cytosine967-C5)-methyltransferase
LAISPARSIAYRILRRVEAGGGFAVDLLQTPEVSALKDADRRLATEIVMGVLRWSGELDFRIAEVSGKPVERLDPEVATILRLGIYQIQFLARVPKAAVVNEAVEMTKAARKRSAAGFVNALLRKVTPRGAGTPLRFEDLDEAGQASVRRTVPAWLLKRWESMGDDVALRLAWASTQVPPTVLRVVNLGDDIVALRDELASDGVDTQLGKFSPRALVVTSGNVQASQALRQGRVVIQDEASQLVVDLLMAQEGQRVLDLCAAPGVKAGQIAQKLRRGILVTCDRGASRLRTMARLLPQWVPEQVQRLAVRLDASEALPFGCPFDRILLDAPCSGTGTLARNPEIKWRLREGDLARLAEAQAKMLKGALENLDQGGRLVYATCSLEREENEGVVERALAESPQYRLVSRTELESAHPTLSPLFGPEGYLRTRPDLHNMDGFFAAVIERKGA